MVGCVVEGHGEERVVVHVLNWLGVKRINLILRAEGVNDLLIQSAVYAGLLRAKGADLILFFVDADGPDAGPREQQLRQRLEEAGYEDSVVMFVPVYELEAWLLADEAALGAVLGESVARIQQPEAPEPVSQITELFSRAGRSYRKSRDAELIAQKASDRAWSRCPSYVRSTSGLRSLPTSS